MLHPEDGRIVFGGHLSVIEGISSLGLIQISPDGVLDVEFTPRFSWDIEPRVPQNGPHLRAGAIQADGKVLIAGRFTSVDGLPKMGLVRLHDTSPTNLNLVSVSVPSWAPSIIEGNTNLLVEIFRAGDPSRPISVGYTAVSGTALSEQDFKRVDEIVRFEAGERMKVVSIPVLDDSLQEGDETFTLQLTNLSDGVNLSPNGSQEVTIIDDDGIKFWKNEIYVSESSRELELIAVSGNMQNYVVSYKTKEETARAEVDFGAVTGTLTFSAWWQDSGSRSILLPIFDNAEMDGNRSFIVTLLNPTSGLPVGPNSNIRVIIEDNDTAAGPFKGINGTIAKSAALPDGRIMITGWFTAVEGHRRNYIARIHPNGAVDPSFNPGKGPNGPVTALALQPDGKIVIGGVFTEVSGMPFSRIARLKENGQVDVSFSPGAGWEGEVIGGYDEWPTIRALAIQKDGKILSAGSYRTYNSVLTPCLARLNPDGSLDRSFSHSLDQPLDLRSLSLQADGKILVGGHIASSSVYDGVIRLNKDGSIDNSFTSFRVGKAHSLLVRSDAKIFVGGIATDFRAAIVTLYNSDGTRDDSFNHTNIYHYLTAAYDLAELPGGKILAVGRFRSYIPDSPNSVGMIRLYSDGTEDTSFRKATENNWPVLVRTITLQSDGEMFLGGTFGQLDEEEVAKARRSPTFGFTYIDRHPDAYFGLRLENDGSVVNDLNFERLVKVTDGSIHMSLGGQAPGPFVLEKSEDLVNWQLLHTNTIPNRGLVFRDQTSTSTTREFYRARLKTR